MRIAKVLLLCIGIALIPLAVGAWVVKQHEGERAALDRTLTNVSTLQAQRLASTFERARAINLLVAHDPVFQDFYAEPGGLRQRIGRGGETIERANDALAYLEQLHPGAIGEACFIDAGGQEIARVVRGVRAEPADLSPDESRNPFFTPTFLLPLRDVYQAAPYLSPDTGEWVISNSTRVPGVGAIVHYELTVESLRAEADRAADGIETVVVDVRSGRTVLASNRPIVDAGPLGRVDAALGRISHLRSAERVATVGGRRVAFTQLPDERGNANHWLVVAVAPATGGIVGIGLLPLALVLGIAFGVAALMGVRWAQKSDAADTDVLTGLGNRRRLIADLDGLGERRATFVMYDLDGFKLYNDAFGHPAGDALLARLGARLAAAVAGQGAAYRLGGDEFCVVIPADESPVPIVAATLAALSERGEGFEVGCSHGLVVLPREARNASDALRAADARLYANKTSGRRSPGRQSTDVLIEVLRERSPELGHHAEGVAALARSVGELLGLDAEELEQLAQAAELHDIGKVAIPDAILTKPSALDEEEWAFVRQHTSIGERILSAAPSLANVGKVVRSSHERWDGSGYPDGLAGEEIPLGGRIVTVCDAFDAMVSGRPYLPARSVAAALAELRSCAGSQFDCRVVEAFCAAVGRRTVAAARV